jgi:hypothetical protein
MNISRRNIKRTTNESVSQQANGRIFLMHSFASLKRHHVRLVHQHALAEPSRVVTLGRGVELDWRQVRRAAAQDLALREGGRSQVLPPADRAQHVAPREKF